MTASKAVFFDIDGVLVDSLEPHLQICRDKSREYGLGLDIPDASELRAMVMRGVVISPMRRFFLAVGFPESEATRATEEYEQEFTTRYAPRPFPGVSKALSFIRSSLPTVKMGFVTSNTLSIVRSSLGELILYFEDEYQFSFDHPAGTNKRDALKIGAERARLPQENLLFVGDQPTDLAAAKATGTPFLGVSYGWGFTEAKDDLPLAHSVDDLAMRIVAWGRA